MYPSVTKVLPHDDFTLSVEFENGEEGVLDMKPHLGFGVFRRIADVEVFKTARVSFDSIEWDHGVDLDPEYVYSHCRKTEKA